MNRPGSESNLLLGVVLGGGRSSRMGQDKASLPHPHGGTFLSHAIERLQRVCDQVVVSGRRPEGDAQASSVPSLPDPTRYQGPATGIAASLDYARQHDFAACLVTPVDMPLLERGDLQRLVDSWTQQRQLTCAITADDHRQPLVAIYPVELSDELKQLAASADRSLTRWLCGRSHATIHLSPTSSRNINSTEDLRDLID